MSLFTCSTPRIGLDKLKEEIESLTEQEREQVHRDVYGTEQAIPENPEFNRDALERLEASLRNIPEKEAFELAQLYCPEYVNGDEFRLMFLRAERFHAPTAAQKIVTYWEKKVGLFGPDRAFRKISIEDIDNDEDRQALQLGGIQFMPGTDSAGRGIFVSRRVNWDLRRGHEYSMIRFLWYIIHAGLENFNIQRNGAIFILANGLPFKTSYNAKLNRNLWRDGLEILPLRIQAFHQVAENELMKMMIETNLFVLGSRFRARFRVHAVEPSNLMQELVPYGIPDRLVPVEFGGGSEYDYQEWLEEQYQSGE